MSWVAVPWWILICLPALILGAQYGFPSEGPIGALLSLYAIFALMLAVPWGLRWYLLAAGLMFGRRTAAEEKRKWLDAHIKSLTT